MDLQAIKLEWNTRWPLCFHKWKRSFTTWTYENMSINGKVCTYSISCRSRLFDILIQSCGLRSFSVERFRDFVHYAKENISKLELFSFGWCPICVCFVQASRLPDNSYWNEGKNAKIEIFENGFLIDLIRLSPHYWWFLSQNLMDLILENLFGSKWPYIWTFIW